MADGRGDDALGLRNFHVHRKGPPRAYCPAEGIGRDGLLSLRPQPDVCCGDHRFDRLDTLVAIVSVDCCTVLILYRGAFICGFLRGTHVEEKVWRDRKSVV